MSARLKIVICVVTTVSVIAVGSHSPVAARRLNLPQGITLPDSSVPTFQPDPSRPPVVTQGSGTR